MIILTAKIEYDDNQFIELTPSNSISIERSLLDRENVSMPSFGIVSNGGKIAFIDVDGTIKNLINNNTLRYGLPVNISLSNTTTRPEATTMDIGQLYASKWNYDNDSKKVTVNIVDGLEDWQNILINAIGYSPFNDIGLSFKWLYDHLWGLTPLTYNMLEFSELDGNTQNILLNSHFEFKILDSKNLWDGWTKLCQACQCHIFKSRNSRTVFKYNGGN